MQTSKRNRSRSLHFSRWIAANYKSTRIRIFDSLDIEWKIWRRRDCLLETRLFNIQPSEICDQWIVKQNVSAEKLCTIVSFMVNYVFSKVS